jgi:hypothetical protein
LTRPFNRRLALVGPLRRVLTFTAHANSEVYEMQVNQRLRACFKGSMFKDVKHLARPRGFLFCR